MHQLKEKFNISRQTKKLLFALKQKLLKIPAETNIANNIIVISYAVLPILTACSGVFYDKLPPWSENIFIILSSVYIFFMLYYHMVFSKIKITDSTFADLLNEHLSFIELKELHKEISFLANLSMTKDSLEKSKYQLIEKFKPLDPDKYQLRPSFINLFKVIYDVLDKERLYGELFSIALYIYDEKTEINGHQNNLRDYYSYKNPLMFKTPGGGRTWHISQPSHICSTFNDNDENKFFIHENLQLRAKEAKPENQKNDEKYYVSAISYPIKFKNDKNRGVFCILSNIEARFGFKDENKNTPIMKIINANKYYQIKKIAKIFEELFLLKSENDNDLLIKELT